MVSSFSVFDPIEQLREQVLRQEAAIAKLTERVYALEHGATAHTEKPGPLPTIPDAPPRQTVARPAVDWEALVGANWLNRLGVLVLVIGIALFLGYSLTQLGPLGKAAIGGTIGLAMLLSGVALRRGGRYETLGISLAGGGWAVLYFTSYAIYALPPARLITDPVTATLLLLVISCSMVLHALLARNQAATTLAYLIAFTSLNLYPLSTFALVAMVILAASAVLVAHRFEWPRVAVAGALFTYGGFLLRYEDPVYHQAGVLNGQLALWVYWCLYELYTVRSKDGRVLFGVNALGFLGSSFLVGQPGSPHYWAIFLFTAAGAYAASAALRRERDRAIAVSAWLFALGLIEQLSGVRQTAALLAEGEALVWAGVFWDLPNLRRLGGMILVLPVVRIVLTDSQGTSHSWVPIALLAAALFLLQRWIYKMDRAYAYAGVLLLGAVISAEFGRGWITIGLGVMALAILVCGLLFHDIHTRYAGFLVLAAALTKLFVHDLSELDTPSRIITFVGLGILLLASSWGYTRFLRPTLTKLSGDDPVAEQAESTDVL